MDNRFEGQVALITGGAQGFGAGLARRLAGLGARVVIADINCDPGNALANEIGGLFVACDVSSLAANEAAVAQAVSSYGGLDIVALNAGVTSACSFGPAFDPARYRQVMAINLDGVVLGFQAALAALRARGGGRVIATSSMAGIAPTPFDAIYSANKSAVVGLVRSLGVAFERENIKVNAICPAFADTAILGELREGLTTAGVPLLQVEEVVDVFEEILTSELAGQCWFVQPGRQAEPFKFRRAPGPRQLDGSIAPAADPQTQLKIEESRRARQG